MANAAEKAKFDALMGSKNPWNELQKLNSAELSRFRSHLSIKSDTVYFKVRGIALWRRCRILPLAK